MIQDIISIIATRNVHSMSKVIVFISITLSSSMLSNYHNRRVTKTNYKEDSAKTTWSSSLLWPVIWIRQYTCKSHTLTRLPFQPVGLSICLLSVARVVYPTWIGWEVRTSFGGKLVRPAPARSGHLASIGDNCSVRRQWGRSTIFRISHA